MSSPIIWKFPPSPFKKEVASDNTQLKNEALENITENEPPVKNELMVIKQPPHA